MWRCTRDGCETAAAAVEHQFPFRATLHPHDLGAGTDVGTALGRIDCVEHHQPAVIHPAVGIFKAVTEQPLQRLPDRIMREIDGARAGQ